MRPARLVAAASAASLLCSSAALAAPDVRVSAGTLSIEGTDDAPVSALITAYTSISEVFGPPAGQSTLIREFAYGPRFAWHGTAPVAGPGCGPESGHPICPDVARMEIALGGRDDALQVVASRIDVRVGGGSGDDALTLNGGGLVRVLDGGPGDDALALDINSGETGSVIGGAGDDYIAVDGPVAVDCGPGDDNVVERLWQYHRKDPPRVDEATCAPVLRAIDAPEPPGADELRFPAGIEPRRGRVRMAVFRPSEDGRGTIQLRRARSFTRLGFPAPGTKWSACSERRTFRMRAGHTVRSRLRLVPRIARAVARLEPPGSKPSPASTIPCSFHVSGVDDDGERFRRDDFSILLINRD